MNNLNHQKPCILITIDVEDWFQVENFKSYIPFSTWDSRELRVEQNVYKLLDLFDSFSNNSIGTVVRADKINSVNINKEEIDFSQLYPEGEKAKKSSKSCESYQFPKTRAEKAGKKLGSVLYWCIVDTQATVLRQVSTSGDAPYGIQPR